MISRIQCLAVRFQSRVGGSRPAVSQSGFTLVEMMIALTLSLLMIVGALELYVNSKKAYRNLEASARLLENGRLAMELTYRSIRLARYWGCSGINDAKVTNHLGYDASDATSGKELRGIFGSDNTGLNGSDEITILQIDEDVTSPGVVDIRSANYDPTDINSPDPLRNDGEIWVAEGTGDALRTGASWGDGDDYIVVNDCGKADILEITGNTVQSGVNDKLLVADSTYTTCGYGDCTYQNCEVDYESLGISCSTFTYNTTASVYKVKKVRLFLANNTAGEPALYMQEDGGTAQELVEGVENMQIYYGQDTNGSGNVTRYVTPAVINSECSGSNECWRNIASVRIALLLRSSELNVTGVAQTYNFDGTSYTASDGRLRREFVTIDSIRNHR